MFRAVHVPSLLLSSAGQEAAAFGEYDVTSRGSRSRNTVLEPSNRSDCTRRARASLTIFNATSDDADREYSTFTPGYFASNASTMGRTIWLMISVLYQTTEPSSRAASINAWSGSAAHTACVTNSSATTMARIACSPTLPPPPLWAEPLGFTIRAMTTLALGRAARHAWRLDPDFVTVNHGSFGATPECVLAEQDAWRRRMEAQPTRFMGTVLPGALRDSANRLAAFVGADGEDLAFVDNATSGCNAVLRSLALRPDDEVLVLDHGYGAVRNAVRFVTERAGARMTEAVMPFPEVTADEILVAVTAALRPRTRLAVIDHITSGSALIVPLVRSVAACHDAGVP